MKHTPLETTGMIVNGFSIALFFYLAITLEVSDLAPAVRYLGWLLFGLGIVLIVLSVVTLMIKHEAGLITRGIYGVVRHPMYLGAILLFLSWVFFLPHWIVLLISIVNAAICYWFILQGDRSNIIKFGDSYQRYMETVPSVNLFAGLFRSLRRE